jgi:hypothetical protein
MWMHRVDLVDGTVVEAYKHRLGRGYELVGDAAFEEGDPMVLLVKAIMGAEGAADIARHDDWVDGK